MSAYSNNHILYGNYGLSNRRVQVSELGFLNSSPVDLQTIPISRGSGSSVVRARNDSRNIKISGGVTKTENVQDEDSILYMTSELNRIFNFQDRYLRTVPKSKMTVIDSCQSTSGWTASDDAQNIVLDTKNFQWEKASVGFDVNVSLTANNFATLTKTLSTPVNLSAFTDSGNFEFWLDIDDVYYVDSVELRIGSDSSNYYTKVFTTNYEGGKLENGSNYFSTDWGNEVQGRTITQIGTVNNSTISYVLVRINYQSLAVNFKADLGGIFHVQEKFVRNYPCYSKGGVNWNPAWFAQTGNLANSFEVDLLNYTGYGIATHSIQLFNQLAITTASNTQVVDLKGNLEPQINNTFTLNATTNLTDLRYSNLNKNEQIRWTNTWVNGDLVNFDKLNTTVTRNNQPQDFEGKLPGAVLGKNRLQMSVVQVSNSTISHLSYNSERGFSLNERLAQSFASPINGSISWCKITMRYPESLLFKIGLYSNSAGAPNTAIMEYNTGSPTTGIGVQEFTFPGVSLVAGTTYWIVVRQAITSGSRPFWQLNSTNPYGSGQALFFNGSTWSNITGDFSFEVQIEPTPATNIDWKASYKPLYL